MLNDRFIRAFRKGEEWAFRRIYEQFFDPLCVYAAKYLRNSNEAQDVVQDVFAALWLLHDNFDNCHTIRSFLYISVRNRSINLLRHQNLTIEKISQMQQKHTPAEESEMVIEVEVERQLLAAVQHLPSECRRVLQLSIEGRSYQEIGEMLHITTNTVKNHRVRAVKKLREMFRYYRAESELTNRLSAKTEY